MDNLSKDQMCASLLADAGWVLDPARQEGTDGLNTWSFAKMVGKRVEFSEASKRWGPSRLSYRERESLVKAAAILSRASWLRLPTAIFKKS
jgi:hypothetical protein